MSCLCADLRHHVLLAAAWSCLLTVHAHAVTTNWIDSGGGSFTESSNWDNGVPGSADTAVFNRGFVAYTVTFPGSIFDPQPNFVIDYLHIDTNEVTFAPSSLPIYHGPRGLTVANPGYSTVVGMNLFDVAILNMTLRDMSGTIASIGRASGATGTLNVSSGTFSMSDVINVGEFGAGTLNVTAGGRVESNNAIHLGYHPGSQGQALVSGANSQLISSRQLSVGDGGTGTLTIQSGGHTFSDFGSVGLFGMATITGADSTWTSGGLAVNGTLAIEAGGRVLSGSSGTESDVVGTGTVSVTGSGSTWTNGGPLYVDGPLARLSIEAGGHVSNADAEIAFQPASHGTVTVVGDSSTWTNSGLVVGRGGTGSLTIDAGASVSSSTSYLGVNAGATGAVTVSGSDSKWTTGSLYAGYAGTGTLNITSGAEVVSTSAYIGTFAAQGMVTVDGAGSMWDCDDVTIGNSDANGPRDTLLISDGGAVSVDSVLLVERSATLAGNSSVAASLVNRGEVRPGLNPGSLTGVTLGALHINGSYLQSATGSLVVRLAGTTPVAQYDQLQVSGTATLNGTLSVALANSFVPSAGNSFDILDWGSLSGTFNTITLPALASGLMWDASNLYTSGALTVVAASLAGDYNHNGIVDAADYVLWRKNPENFGGTPAGYNIWRANFGRTTGPAGSSTTISQISVPEPESILLGCVALAGVLTSGRTAFPRHRLPSMTGCNPHFGRRAGLIVAAFSLLLSSYAHAVTTDWNTNSSGNFTNAANWDNGVPDSDDTAVFNRGTGVAYTVGYPGGVPFAPPLTYSIDTLVVSSSEVTFAKSSSQFATTNPNLDVVNPALSIVIGEGTSNAATLNTTLNNLSGVNAWIANEGGNGTLNVTAGIFSTSGEIDVGHFGTGTLNVTADGRVENLHAKVGEINSPGQVTVSGPNARWIITNELSVGYLGNGTVTIEAGGHGAYGSGYIGRLPGSNGTLIVTGSGSTLGESDAPSTGFMNVGYQGTGVLRIENGGAVSTDNGVIGSQTGSNGTAIITGTGSSWTQSSGLTVGQFGMGTLTIANAGNVSTHFAVFVGAFNLGATGVGIVNVDGVGSTLVSADLRVGLPTGGSGTVNITGGGTVSSGAGYVGIGIGTAATRGKVTVDGNASVWSLTGDLTIGSNSLNSDGTVIVSNGGRASVAGFVAIDRLGTLAGNSVVSAPVVSNRGNVAPGLNPGVLNGSLTAKLQIEGNYSQSSAGSLRIRIAGSTPGADYDQLQVTGAATLNGYLWVDLANSFQPSAGNSFDLLDWGSLSGKFAAIVLPALSTGLMWNASQLYTDGTLRVTIAGDYNNNGVVDAADYVVWRNTLGQIGSGLDADGNANNQIDAGDYNIWRAHFGQTTGSGSGFFGLAVPEPSPAARVVMMFMTLLFAAGTAVRSPCRGAMSQSA